MGRVVALLLVPVLHGCLKGVKWSSSHGGDVSGTMSPDTHSVYDGVTLPLSPRTFFNREVR